MTTALEIGYSNSSIDVLEARPELLITTGYGWQRTGNLQKKANCQSGKRAGETPQSFCPQLQDEGYSVLHTRHKHRVRALPASLAEHIE